jgi:sulfur carrier protein
MTLIVNGEKREVAGGTLADALRALNYGEAKVATALNGEFVPARARGLTSVKDGDRLEILAPRQGG